MYFNSAECRVELPALLLPVSFVNTEVEELLGKSVWSKTTQTEGVPTLWWKHSPEGVKNQSKLQFWPELGEMLFNKMCWKLPFHKCLWTALQKRRKRDMSQNPACFLCLGNELPPVSPPRKFRLFTIWKLLWPYLCVPASVVRNWSSCSSAVVLSSSLPGIWVSSPCVHPRGIELSGVCCFCTLRLVWVLAKYKLINLCLGLSGYAQKGRWLRDLKR